MQRFMPVALFNLVFKGRWEWDEIYDKKYPVANMINLTH